MPGRAARLCLPGALGPGTWGRREGAAAGMVWHQRVTIWVSPCCCGDPRALSRVSNPMALGQGCPSLVLMALPQVWEHPTTLGRPKSGGEAKARSCRYELSQLPSVIHRHQQREKLLLPG